MRQYPKGRFAGQAKILLVTLKDAATKAENPVVDEGPELALWDSAQKQDTVSEYEAFLAAYPKGKHSVLAKSRIIKIQDKMAAEASTKLKNDEDEARSQLAVGAVQAHSLPDRP